MTALAGNGNVASFFSNKTILVTGTTGFLGAVLVEKLLRSCPDVERIYLLIRKKEDASIEKRLNTLLSLPLFSGVSAQMRDKLVAVEGDVGSVDAGLSESDKKKLLNDVQIVFHVAAYVNFNARVGRAVRINVQGTSYILDLAKRMPNIKVFVYTSTAYCNCLNTDVIAEKVYPCQWEPREIIKLVESTPADELEEKQLSILGKTPNAYVFSKLLAENLISAEREDVPVAIVRPTIVMGTLKSPTPGWVDNVNNGPAAFIAGAGRGIFRTIHGDGSKVADVVPCDQFANLLVAAAWEMGTNGGMKVYHHSSGSDNPIRWSSYCRFIIEACRKYPCNGLVLYPKARVRSSKLRNELCDTFTHYLPALVLDFLSAMIGNKSVLMNIMQRYFKGMHYTSYFTVRQWSFDKKNTNELAKKLTLEELDEHDFDTTRIDWPVYLENCVRGVKYYFHKQSDKNLQLAKLGLLFWKLVDRGYQLLSLAVVCSFFFSITGSEFISIILGVVLLLFYIWF